MDPVSDEWTAFVTVPEKSISPAKSLPMNVELVGEKSEIHTEHIMAEEGNEVLRIENTKLKENEDGALFEMDLESVENKVSVDNSSKDVAILQESTQHNETLTLEHKSMLGSDQIIVQKSEVTSKHVLR